MSGIESGWGLDFVVWLQSLGSPILEMFAKVFHELGSENFFMVLVPFIYWSIDAMLGRRMFFLLVSSIWVNGALKLAYQRPRPYEAYPDRVENIVNEESPFGLPSGHTQTATALAAPLAYHLKRGWLTALMVLYVVLMMFSRMIGGAHYPQDVIAAAFIGLAIFGVYVALERPITDQLQKMGMWAEIAAVLVIGAVMYAIHPGLISGPSEIVDSSVAAVGVLIGGGIGFVLESRYLRFSAQGIGWKRALRLVIGIAVILGIRYGLGAVFENLEPANLFRLIRYIIIGLWAGYGAPWVFVKTRLADRRTTSDTQPV